MNTLINVFSFGKACLLQIYYIISSLQVQSIFLYNHHIKFVNVYKPFTVINLRVQPNFAWKLFNLCYLMQLFITYFDGERCFIVTWDGPWLLVCDICDLCYLGVRVYKSLAFFAEFNYVVSRILLSTRVYYSFPCLLWERPSLAFFLLFASISKWWHRCCLWTVSFVSFPPLCRYSLRQCFDVFNAAFFFAFWCTNTLFLAFSSRNTFLNCSSTFFSLLISSCLLLLVWASVVSLILLPLKLWQLLDALCFIIVGSLTFSQIFTDPSVKYKLVCILLYVFTIRSYTFYYERKSSHSTKIIHFSHW